jgi:hypothetical protein
VGAARVDVADEEHDQGSAVAWHDEDCDAGEGDVPADVWKCAREERLDGGDVGKVPLPYLVDTLELFEPRASFLACEARPRAALKPCRLIPADGGLLSRKRATRAAASGITSDGQGLRPRRNAEGSDGPGTRFHAA